MTSPRRRITAKVNVTLTSVLIGNEGGDAMDKDETGMTDADEIGLVEDVLGIWGEEAARELAEQYGVDLEALGQAVANASLTMHFVPQWPDPCLRVVGISHLKSAPLVSDLPRQHPSHDSARR